VARSLPAARRRPALAAAGGLALALLAAAPSPAQEAGPLRYTLKTIDNEAGVRVILEFTRKPAYDVRRDSRRIYVGLKEAPVEPPFKKKDYDGNVLEKIKFVDGVRTSEIVLYTGDDFETFSTFEMGEPFRIVIDLRRKLAPPMVVGVPSAGGAPPATRPPASAPPAAGSAPPAARIAEGGPAAPAGGTPGAEPPRKSFVVVVDPGHGGDDTGARGPSGLMEKDVTLDVARRVKTRIASEMDADVMLTRDTDRAVALDERTAIANHNRADLFVSIHANASRRPNARGSETYFLSYQATDDESRAVAAIENNAMGLEGGVQGNSSLEMVLWDLAQSAFLKESSVLAEIVQENMNDALGVANRGIKQAPFRVLMGATMPAVLIEVAFISNPDEEKRLKDPGFKDKLAASIFDGIKRFQSKYGEKGAR